MTGSILGALAAQTEDVIERLRPSVVLVRGRDGHGAGIIWEKSGLIVTNDHVASRDRAIVELADGRRLEAWTLARDQGNDLALLQVSARDLVPAIPGDSRSLRVGDVVVAIGHPWGVRETATLGIISAAAPGNWSRPENGTRVAAGRTQRELLQADVRLAPGNSGGPLVDTSARVVGIASMVMSPGIALAVPTHIVQRFVAAALANTYRRAA